MPKAYGSTDIRIIQHGDVELDLEPILKQLREIPGVVAAGVAWANERLDDWEAEIAEGGRRGNAALRRSLTKR